MGKTGHDRPVASVIQEFPGSALAVHDVYYRREQSGMSGEQHVQRNQK